MTEPIVAPLDLTPLLVHLLKTKVNARIVSLMDDLELDPAGEQALALRKAFAETLIDVVVAAITEYSALLIEHGVDVRLSHDITYPTDEDYEVDG